jgi:hypothetical protein
MKEPASESSAGWWPSAVARVSTLSRAQQWRSLIGSLFFCAGSIFLTLKPASFDGYDVRLLGVRIPLNTPFITVLGFAGLLLFGFGIFLFAKVLQSHQHQSS